MKNILTLALICAGLSLKAQTACASMSERGMNTQECIFFCVLISGVFILVYKLLKLSK